MASRWQLWLSPRPQRTVTPSEPRVLSAHDAALFEFLYEENGRLVVRETHYAENKLVRDGLSGPPLHIHLCQTEYFQVEQGVLGVERNGGKHALTKDDSVFKIPAGSRHRFWPLPSMKEDVIFKVWPDPQGVENPFDEAFLRNYVGYLRDCAQANMKPSVFQLALFGCSSGTVRTPPFWMPKWILKAVHHVIAYWIAKPWLGYQETYPEYSGESSYRCKDNNSVQYESKI